MQQFTGQDALVMRAFHFCKYGVKIFACSGKRPVAGLEWRNDASSDAGEVEGQFLHPSASAIGLPCGENDLLVFDLDVPSAAHPNSPNGVAAFDALRRDMLAQGLPDIAMGAVRIVTPNGGEHLIFRQPRDGRRYGNSTGSLPAGIDVRGDGGYVIAVGSTLDAGSYRQVSGPDLLDAIKNDALVDAPDELLALLKSRPKTSQVSASPASGSQGGVWTEELLKEALAQIPNDQTFMAREDWVKMGHHIFAASQGAEWGRALWEEWSNQQPQKPGETDHVWHSFGTSGVRATGGMILEHLERVGAWDLRDKVKNSSAKNVFTPLSGAELAAMGIVVAPPLVAADPLKDFYFDGDALPTPPPAIVEGLVPAKGLTFIGGQSGAGKSFVAVDLALSLATGRDFLGRTVEQCAVIYVAAEGYATIPSRILAAKIGAGLSGARLAIAAVAAPFDMRGARERQEFMRRLKAAAGELHARYGLRVGAVIVDTFAAAFSMTDENSAAEMNLLCKAADELGSCVGAATVVVHHYGKDATTGLRGSSALRGAAESVIAVMKVDDQGNRKISHDKSRSGEEGATWDFRIVSEVVGQNPKDGSDQKVGRLVLGAGPGAGSAGAGGNPDLLDQQVLRSVDRLPVPSFREIARDVGLDPNADRFKVRNSCERLTRHGLLKLDRAAGHYSITAAGKLEIREQDAEIQNQARSVF